MINLIVILILVIISIIINIISMSSGLLISSAQSTDEDLFSICNKLSVFVSIASAVEMMLIITFGVYTFYVNYCM